MRCPLYGKPRGCIFFSTSGSKCVPGKESRRFHYVGIWAKILLSPWISDWDLPPVVQNTHELLHHRLPCVFILPLQTQTHPSLTKNTQYYCPSRSAGKEMMASTNTNDNQWLCEAKRHKRSSSPCTRSSTDSRICNFRCLKKMFIGKRYFSIVDPSVKSHSYPAV